ncbi:MAG: hypothetical protein NTAFB01_21070 [Nitrospira sp.]
MPQTASFRKAHVTGELTDCLDLLSLVQGRLQGCAELESVGQSMTGLHLAIGKLEALRALVDSE